MKIYVDECGSFSWYRAGRSVFCGLIIGDNVEKQTLEKFQLWRESIIGGSRRELKGSELTDIQLESFVDTVFPPGASNLWFPVIGIDTSRTKREFVEALRGQAAAILTRSAEICKEHGNSKLHEQYRQMAGWISKRSPENIVWMAGLVEVIIESLQAAIVAFMEPHEDQEFENLEIIIDQSFIKRPEHISFWREWLRSDLAKSSRTDALLIPDTWRPRNHPFIDNYSIYRGLLDLRPLFVDKTRFASSNASQGLQIVDICSNVVYRYHRASGARRAYERLKRRIALKDGYAIRLIEINEKSLHLDDPRNHAGVFDIAEYKRRADLIHEES